MAIRTVVTRGFGNGTFAGDIGLVVTRGYLPGEEVVEAPAVRGGIHPYQIREWKEWWERKRAAEAPPIIEGIPETEELNALESVPRVNLEDISDRVSRKIAEHMAAQREQRRVELIAQINARLEQLELEEMMALLLIAAS